MNRTRTKAPPLSLPDGAGAPEWDEGLECWVVADPRLARQVLNHTGFASGTFERSFQLYMTEASREEYRELTEFLRLWFVQTDAPEHAALRRPVQRIMSASYVRSLAPRIEEITEECLDDLAAARPHDVMPTVADGISGKVMAHVVGVGEQPHGAAPLVAGAVPVHRRHVPARPRGGGAHRHAGDGGGAVPRHRPRGLPA